MKHLFLIGFPLVGLALFSAQILAESSRLAVVRTWRACKNMSRVEDFFPKYKVNAGHLAPPTQASNEDPR